MENKDESEDFDTLPRSSIIEYDCLVSELIVESQALGIMGVVLFCIAVPFLFFNAIASAGLCVTGALLFVARAIIFNARAKLV